MKDKQQEFYSSISKYYSEIFPYNPLQLSFVRNMAGELAGKSILDIGCATGELALQLAGSGAKVVGIDLNENLLQQARNGCSGFQSADSELSESEFALPTFHNCNMLELEKDFQYGQFDVVLCFGNTLVHLPAIELVQQMLEGVKYVLKPGGQFLLQILNYDYITSSQITELPLIETDNLRFIRKYRFENNSPLIYFQTELVLKRENRTVTNETQLLGLKSADLVTLLKTSGYREIQLFSNFKQDTVGGKHLPLVLSTVR